MSAEQATTARWAWPFRAKQFHVRVGPSADFGFTSGKALCGKHFQAWYPVRSDVQDDDERCCAKCRAALLKEGKKG